MFFFSLLLIYPFNLLRVVLLSMLYIDAHGHRARVPRRVLHTSVWLLRMMGGVGFRVIDMDSLSIALSIDSTLIKQSVCVWIHHIVGPCDVGNRVRLWITTEIEKKTVRKSWPCHAIVRPFVTVHRLDFSIHSKLNWHVIQNTTFKGCYGRLFVPHPTLIHKYTCWLDITTDPNGLYDCDKKTLEMEKYERDGKI